VERDRGDTNEDDFLVAIGEAAQDAVWETQHPLTHHLAEDDPRRAQYLREYQMSVGCQVLTAIENLRRRSSCDKRPRERPPAIPPNADFTSSWYSTCPPACRQCEGVIVSSRKSPPDTAAPDDGRCQDA
jgi:hypothetical protein